MVSHTQLKDQFTLISDNIKQSLSMVNSKESNKPKQNNQKQMNLERKIKTILPCGKQQNQENHSGLLLGEMEDQGGISNALQWQDLFSENKWIFTQEASTSYFPIMKMN